MTVKMILMRMIRTNKPVIQAPVCMYRNTLMLAAALLFFSGSMAAQEEVPLEYNPLLQMAAQKSGAGLATTKATPEKNPTAVCPEPKDGIYYLRPGEFGTVLLDTAGVDKLQCTNCNSLRAGTVEITSGQFRYTAANTLTVSLDTVRIELCKGADCREESYVFLVKRNNSSRVEATDVLRAGQEAYIRLPVSSLPGQFACSMALDCPDTYPGIPASFWISLVAPNEFFYKAGSFAGVDTVCVLLCDEYTVCDTLKKPFRIRQDTIALPFFDDFSYTGPYPDPNRWLDRDVFVNATLGVQPVSVGVATFDGLNFEGKPYGGESGFSDALTSPYFDLDAGMKNVFLSFWLQPMGLGDKPELNDAFVIEFKNPAGRWTEVKRIDGISPVLQSPPFDFYSVPVTGQYLYRGFQFRFRNISSRTGILDLWHLDYVRLESDNIPDRTAADVAFTQLPDYILKQYTSMPWAHFHENEDKLLFDTVHVGLYNHFDETRSITDSRVILERIGAPLFLPRFELATTNIEPAEFVENARFIPDDIRFGFLEKIINIADPQRYEFDLTYTLSISNQTPGAEDNDRVSRITVFDNYFAHDDGSAETAIIAPDDTEVAVEFESFIEDTLRAIRIHIPHANANVLNQRLNLKVWTEGLDKTPEYQFMNLEPVYVDEYRDTLQAFITYLLEDENGKLTPLPLPKGKFYIGWQQASRCQGTQCIPVGLDKNSPGAAQYSYRRLPESDVWELLPNSVPAGALMIRPVVGSETPTATGVESLQITGLSIFPNPAQDQVNIRLPQGNYYDYQAELINVFGQIIWQGNLAPQLNLANFAGGWYALRITDARGASLTHKIMVINH